MIGSGDDGDGKRHSCLDCDDGKSQACVVGLEEGDDALVLLPLNHPPALSHLEWIMAAIVHMPFGALAILGFHFSQSIARIHLSSKPPLQPNIPMV